MDRFARALATVVNILDPDVIVLGGGLSNIERDFTAICRRWWKNTASTWAGNHAS